MHMQHFAILTDGSGAPCVIESRGYTFAFDYLGELKRTLISNHQRLGKNHAIALAKATAAYLVQLKAQPDYEQFISKNHAMYKLPIH